MPAPKTRAEPGTKPDPIVAARQRELAREFLALKRVVGYIRDGRETVDKNEAFFEKSQEQIRTLIEQVRKDSADSDTIAHVLNMWEHLVQPLDRLCGGGDDVDVEGLKIIEEEIDDIVFHLGMKTIPSRIKEWLDKNHAGGALPFSHLFADEVPRDDHRAWILRYVSWKPVDLEQGLIDPISGFIYKVPKWCKWPLIFLAALVPVALGVVLFSVARENPKLLGDSPLHVAVAWGALLAGALMHVAIAREKVRKATGLTYKLPIARADDYISVKAGPILRQTVIAGVVFCLYFGTVASVSGSESIGEAFLVGYSLDSMWELVASTLDRRSAAQFQAVEAKVKAVA